MLHIDCDGGEGTGKDMRDGAGVDVWNAMMTSMRGPLVCLELSPHLKGLELLIPISLHFQILH